MQLAQAIARVDEKFIYQSDPRSFFTDYWFVMQERDGRLHGDCDDYSITVLWYLCDQNFWTFVWNVLILHRYCLHRVRTRNGEYHVVAQVGNVWFDNWTRRPCTREELFTQTGHEYQLWYLAPIITWFMIWGYFRR